MNGEPADALDRRLLDRHELRISALERDRDAGTYLRRDVYEAKHGELVRADEIQDRALDELREARLTDARRNLAILIGALVSVIGTVAAAVILRGIGGG